MLKKFLVSLSIILIIFCTTVCYAASVPVTDENLSSALQNYTTSDLNTSNYKISTENNIITLTSDDGTYTLNYDLTNHPTFTYEMSVQQGMSYEDFKKLEDNLAEIPMIGYIAVANVQGVSIEDSSTYFAMSYAINFPNETTSTEDTYVIEDDINISDGVTIIKDENDSKTIYTSEFGERVMEYVNTTYKDKMVIADDFSYELTIERQDVTETSCKIVSTLVVNPDADFSELNGYKDNLLSDNTSDDSSQDSVDTTSTTKKPTTEDNTKAKTTLPYAGDISTKLIIATLSIFIVLAIVFVIKWKKIKIQ